MHGGLLTPIFAALILGLSGPHLITSCFAWRPLLLIGESSYCLYLLHFNLYQLLHQTHVLERLHLATLDPWLSYVVLILASLAVYRLYENPVRRAILRRFPPASRKLVPMSS
jgi:peptidoglycan/LPS O-acetylase OafA/YrhL